MLDLLPAPPFNPGPSAHGVALAPQHAIASLAAYKDALEPLQTALGITLPTQGRQLTADGVTYLWSGPARWLALAPTDDPNFAPTLAAKTQNLAAVTDQSDGRVILTIHGPRTRDALAKLVPIDLHPSTFTPGNTALTLAGHIAIQIWQTPDGAYNLACFRSFAEDLYHALTAAALEYTS